LLPIRRLNPHLVRLDAARLAGLVDQTPPGDPRQPGREPRPPVVARGKAPRLQEGFLRNIVGYVGGGHSSKETPQRPLVLGDEHGERGLVSLGRARTQGKILVIAARHCPSAGCD
jgi:hypothetical protein